MRYMIIHKTSPRWEAGEIPGPDLIARVGALLGELQGAGVLQDAAGLRATTHGVRVKFAGGTKAVTHGPFVGGENELPAGFDIVRTDSLEGAIAWATRQAEILGDLEVDIRPVTEPWDIGMGKKPADVTTRRYMVLRKATAATEADQGPSKAQRKKLQELSERSGKEVHLASATMRPSARGRRYKNSAGGLRVLDGPFAESKELIAGYVTVEAKSLDEAGRWAEKYVVAVGAEEVDVRELEDLD